MRELNKEETAILADKIDKIGLKYHPLREEFLDHWCCIVEQKIWEGASFQAALSELTETFKEDEMKKTETDTLSLLHSKSKIMKQISLAVLPFLLLVFFYPHYTQQTEKVVEEITAYTFEPPSISPLADFKRITSGFGMRMHPITKEQKHHKGTDFAAPIGTPVCATSDGVVTLVEEKTKGYGKQVLITHDEVFQSRYAQLSEITVKSGDFVKKGMVIGKVGSSGASTAPHLHYEVLKNGSAVDAEGFMPQ